MQSAFVSLGGSFVTINGAYMPRPPIDPPTELRVVARDGSVPTRRFYIRIISRGAARDAHAFWNPELQVVEVVQVNVTDKVASGPRTQTASYASTERIVLNGTEMIVYDIMLPSPIIPMQMQSIAFSFPVVTETLSTTYPEALVQDFPIIEELSMRALGSTFPLAMPAKSVVFETNTTTAASLKAPTVCELPKSIV